jgi:hypothetical protein
MGFLKTSIKNKMKTKIAINQYKEHVKKVVQPFLEILKNYKSKQEAHESSATNKEFSVTKSQSPK